MSYKSIHIAVLNYNGKALLKECLPSVVKSAKKYPGKCKITVIDNKSTDNSVSFLKKAFKNRVNIYIAGENRILVSYNEFIKNIKEEITIILNNDIKTKDDFLLPLMKYFEDKNTFFVSPKHLGFNGRDYQGGKNKITEKLGYFSIGPFYRNYKKDIDISSPNLFTANGAFRTKIFNRLGGFDPLYLPGGMEDMDLCYRSLKAGYKGYYEPGSIIYHKGSATFKKEFKKSTWKINNYRNSFLFTWKNLRGLPLFRHLLFLPLMLAVFVLTLRFYHIAGFFAAIGRINNIKKSKTKNIVSDSKVIKNANKNYALPVFSENNMQKAISIVIPSYNRIKELKSLLLSLFKQKYDRKKTEIIIVDDGSTDSTQNQIKT